ncbi:SIR2 family protein [Streptomyces sp. NPDC048342]|uniref:SIR2 family NAD-dependent protein deacylase n=2 Tax=Streptomyces TaxID=1883 RepID=UPI003449E7DA
MWNRTSSSRSPCATPPRVRGPARGRRLDLRGHAVRAWNVQEDLIARLAAAEGATGIVDLHAWYQERFGHPATYDGLLTALTTTQHERQALLRAYFEPNDQEREDGLKQPTAAHRAIARLAAAGRVPIVLTTNFDRLMETALREVGIEPTVVADANDARGLAPLHTIKALVIHIHGDYLDHASIRNTPDELDQYDEEIDQLLDRVFTEYGLIISGWSAEWDPALRKAIALSSTHFFASYWADPRPLPESAHKLLTRRGLTYVPADADTFFTQTADAADAVADLARRHPVSIDIAVARTKRELNSFSQAITLHDTLRRELDRIAALPLRTTGPWNLAKGADIEAEHNRRIATLESETELLLALVAVTAYWGSNTTDRWWLRDIEALAAPQPPGGLPALTHLAQGPAVMMIYTAGIAALAAERWDTLVQVLTEPQVEHRWSGKPHAVAALSPYATLTPPGRESSEYLHDLLRPVFTRHLALSTTAYSEAWERFEYLRLLVQNDADQGFDMPHIRQNGYLDTYEPAPATWLRTQIDKHGDSLPLLREGFLGGKLTRLQDLMASVELSFDDIAHRRRFA